MPGKVRFTIVERFWSKVRKTKLCWLWEASTNNQGYGELFRRKIDGGKVLAHRLSFEIFKGPIPNGLEVCHKCDNPLCVRPSHLFLGTHEENMRDALKKNRTVRGELHKNSKLTESDVKKIRRLRKEGFTHKQLALMFCVSRENIGVVLKKGTWSHV